MPPCSDNEDGMSKTATRSVELEPIDRLEEKMKAIWFSMVERNLKAEPGCAPRTRTTADRASSTACGRVSREAKARLELSALKEERDVIRTRVIRDDAPAARALSLLRSDDLAATVIPSRAPRGQRYPIRSTAGSGFTSRGLRCTSIEKIARGRRTHRRPADSCACAVLAALNIADEVVSAAATSRAAGSGELAELPESSSAFLDRVLMGLEIGLPGSEVARTRT